MPKTTRTTVSQSKNGQYQVTVPKTLASIPDEKIGAQSFLKSGFAQVIVKL